MALALGTKRNLGSSGPFRVQDAASRKLGRFWREETFTSLGTKGALLFGSNGLKICVVPRLRSSRVEGPKGPRIGPLKSASRAEKSGRWAEFGRMPEIRGVAPGTKIGRRTQGWARSCTKKLRPHACVRLPQRVSPVEWGKGSSGDGGTGCQAAQRFAAHAPGLRVRKR